MKTYKKIIISLLLCMTCFVSGTAVYAEEVYGGDFIKYKYTLFSAENVESGADYSALAADPLPGKTEICLDFSVNTISDSVSGVIAVQKIGSESAASSPLSVVFASAESSAALKTVNSAGTEVTLTEGIQPHKTYSLTLQLDLAGGKYGAALYENHDKNRIISYKTDLDLGGDFTSCGFKGLDFYSGESDDVAITNLKVSRERIAEGKPVTDFANGAVYTGASLSNVDGLKAGEVYDVYAAFYKNSNRAELAAVEKKSYTYRGFDTYIEAMFPLSDNFKGDYTVSFFVLKQDNIDPLVQREDEFLSNGKFVKDDVSGLTFNMAAPQENYLSWYSLGSTVVYKPTAALDGKISMLCGAVYNSDNKLVDVIACKAADAAENGWQYTPVISGWYKVIFYALTEDNRMIYEKRTYTNIFNYTEGSIRKYIPIEKSGHNFYVTAFENKDYASRNKRYGMSTAGYDGTFDMDIANNLGMQFVRIHAFSWKDIEKTQGVYDWEFVGGENGRKSGGHYDTIFDTIKNKYHFDVIANILYTPLWASSNKDETEPHWDKPRYGRYAPTDMQYIRTFIDELYAKYGRYITEWEIYNEPNYSNRTAFWSDTSENYVKMLKAAYEEIKHLSGSDKNKTQPDTVMLGGLGARNYYDFYREILENGGWQYTDKLPMHGYDLDPWEYYNINEELGIDTDKGLYNTEGHMMLFSKSSDKAYYTEKQLALRTIREYLKQIKLGFERIAFFESYDNHVMGEDYMKFDNTYQRSNNWAITMAGLYRRKPDWEPRFAAGALNTFISETGTVTEYVDEFKTGNVNIVKLSADGEPLYILWGDDLAAEAAADLHGITASAEITDWEGREVSAEGFTVCANEMYFITGLGAAAFAYLPSAQGSERYLGEVLYNNNEAAKHTSTGHKYSPSSASLFNHETGEPDSAAAVWNNMYANAGENSNGLLAVYSTSDGVECVVKVDKGAAAAGSGQLTVAVDSYGGGNPDFVSEFTADITPAGSTVRKTAEALYYGDIPGCSGLNEVIDGGAAFVRETDDAYLYSVFIPNSELYPYSYSNGGTINLGVRFIGYDSSGSSAAICSVNEEGYSVKRPWQFAVIEWPSVFNGAAEFTLKAEPGEYVSVVILNNIGEPVYYNEYVADADGLCTVKTRLAQDGEYTLKAYCNSAGYTVKAFSYKN